MEWGTFLTVVAAVYLLYYGLISISDLLSGSKPKTSPELGTQYDISDLVGLEEPAKIIDEKDYQEPLAAVVPVAKAPVPVPEPVNAGGHSPETPGDSPPPQPAYQEPVPAPDWAAELDEEIILAETNQETIISIPVQGQPLSVTEFLQSFRSDAKSQAASIFS
ncbi:hypothetical protein HUW51_00900 (plasmid) [Adhaeribacter swui]|uniref:Uncharacterized protein n=1 Tax=Adhaeribacter swui TaxID=2086471 RepID=A0A7G7G2G2_9BACT|nr:hypothetical protein [Adhaeribacter swui]QNF31346.1 hypothetical protein HUW51_00900 [Adhaeribacter swui]